MISSVPPPAVPIGVDRDWTQIEAVLGLRLPTDFKGLISRYGGGQFVSHIEPLTPFHPIGMFVPNIGYPAAPGGRSYPLYPTPGGLLVWATTSSSDQFCWLTDGDPDTWPVVTITRDESYEQYPVGAVTFLYEWFAGRLVVGALGERDPHPPWFEHYGTRTHVYLGLSEGPLPYAQRLDILRDYLAPTAYRGSWDQDGVRQDHFTATTRDWMLTYENAYGHQIRVAFPPGHDERVRTDLFEAVERMGCAVLSVRTISGTPVDWDTGRDVIEAHIDSLAD